MCETMLDNETNSRMGVRYTYKRRKQDGRTCNKCRKDVSACLAHRPPVRDDAGQENEVCLAFGKSKAIK